MKRPRLERTRPHRGPASPSDTRGARESAGGGTRNRPPQEDEGFEEELDHGHRHYARRGHGKDLPESAYDVVEDEMRHGFDLARRRGLLAGREIFDLAGAGLRALAQLAGVWMDMRSPLALRRPPPHRRRRAHRHEEDDFEHEERLHEERLHEERLHEDEREWEEEPREDDAWPARTRHDEEIHVSLEISSTKPIIVALDLDRDLAHEALLVSALRMRPDNGQPIKGAAVDVLGEDRVMIRVAVPDDQPPGDYEGVISLQDGRRRAGQLRLTVQQVAPESIKKQA